jgi:hypothetical protein
LRRERALHLFMRSAVLALTILLALLVGCGGGGDAADSSTDVDQLLADTFAGGKEISSGRIDAAVDVEAEGTVAIKLSGPFQSTGEGKLPKLDLKASFEGEGESMSGGVTTTGDQGFVAFGGTQYAIAGPVFEQFKAGFEQSAKESSSGQQDQSLASLGMDPRRWLTNARNAGEAKVGDTDTIKITGDVDVPKLLDDVNRALDRIRSLGVQGSEQLPDQLTDDERKQVTDAVQDLSVEIHTGADDRILRRMLISLRVQNAQDAAQTADVKLDLQLLDLNEDQEIEAPADAKPFEELVQQLEALGLGNLGGLGAGAGSAGGGAAPSEGNVEAYSKCIQDAQGDNAKIRKCADVLTTP